MIKIYNVHFANLLGDRINEETKRRIAVESSHPPILTSLPRASSIP